MQLENKIITNGEFEAQNEISPAIVGQENAQRLCWRMLNEANQVIELSLSDIIEVHGNDKGAHIALLARIYPNLAFETHNERECRIASRILWICEDADFVFAKDASKNCDAIVIIHKVENNHAVLTGFEGFARIAAKRDIGGHSLSIFGRGLMRDLFKPKVRAH